MLYTLAVTPLMAWLLGLVGIYTIGAFVRVLLVGHRAFPDRSSERTRDGRLALRFRAEALRLLPAFGPYPSNSLPVIDGPIIAVAITSRH